MSRLETIRQKIARLAQADPDRKLFGASKHGYDLKPCLDETQVREIEEKHSFKLPDDYRRFIMEIGNGGPGPYYGLDPLEESFPALDLTKDPALLSKRFPLREPLYTMQACLGTDNYDEYYRRIETDEAYFDKIRRCINRFNKPKYSQGVLLICDYGDGISFMLVLNGPERGNMWVDDRVNDGGIFPVAPESAPTSRTDFLTWYETWLDLSLAEIAGAAERSGGYMEFARL